MSWRERKQEELFSEEEAVLLLKDELPHWYLEKGWISVYTTQKAQLFAEY